MRGSCASLGTGSKFDYTKHCIWYKPRLLTDPTFPPLIEPMDPILLCTLCLCVQALADLMEGGGDGQASSQPLVCLVFTERMMP